MKLSIYVILLGLMVVAVGCVSTVDERTTAGVPFIKDKIEGRYERSVEHVAGAAKQVVSANGVLLNESTIYSETNAVRTVEGKVNQRTVWVRIQAIDPKVTSVTVQTRTPGGGSDIDLAHEIEKQIALKLVQQP